MSEDDDASRLRAARQALSRATQRGWAHLQRLNRPIVRGDRRRNHVELPESARCRGLVRFHFDRGGHGNRIVVGEGATMQDLRVRFVGNDSRVVLGAGCTWKGYILVYGNRRTVTIGERSTAIGVFIVCRDADVTIGSGCMFSRDIEVRATDVHGIYDRETGVRLNPPAPVVVGDRVWVAAKATLSKGTVIRDDSVVGAMSFLNRAYDEPNVVIAGAPGRIVRRNITWRR